MSITEAKGSVLGDKEKYLFWELLYQCIGDLLVRRLQMTLFIISMGGRKQTHTNTQNLSGPTALRKHSIPL